MRLVLGFAVLVTACVTRHEEPSRVKLAGAIEETDGVLIEWRNCRVEQPCVHGSIAGKAYEFGFPDSPSTMTGKIGGEAVSFVLDPGSIYRLGDHDIELRFLNKQEGLALDLSWNELDQRLIDHDLLPASF
jgi:hypothetical protein